MGPLLAADEIPAARLRHRLRERLHQPAGAQIGRRDEIRDQRHALGVDRRFDGQEIAVEQQAAMARQLAHADSVQPERASRSGPCRR